MTSDSQTIQEEADLRPTKKPPIISDRILPMRPPELGKIKIGRAGEERTSQGGSKYKLPEKLDHFEVVGRERDKDGRLIRDEAIHESIGDSPTELAIRLYFDDPWDNFQSGFTQYAGDHRLVQCNGETATVYAKRKKGPDGKMTVQRCEEPETIECQRREDGGCQCRPMGRLSCYLEASGFFGAFHVFRTTSWETIRNIQTTLAMLHGQFGYLAGVPLLLKMYPAETSYTDPQGNARKGKAWKVALVMRGTFEEVYARAAEAFQHRIHGQESLKLLAASHQAALDADEGESESDIQREWFPEDDPGADAEAGTADTVADLKERLASTEPADDALPRAEGYDPDGAWMYDDTPEGFGLWLDTDGKVTAFHLDGLSMPVEGPPLVGYLKLGRGRVTLETATGYIETYIREEEASDD